MTNHVPTLETCEKLKDAGYPQQTEFVWTSTGPTRRVQVEALQTHKPAIECAAPILTEILEQLKPYAKKGEWGNGWKGIYTNFFWDDIDSDWSVNIANCDEEFRNPLNAPGGQGDSPAEAAALLWLELNKH
jgi:hypothetical protein